MKVKNCNECRKKIHQEEQKAFLKWQYAWLRDGMYTMACTTAAVGLSVLMRRGRSKAYIKKFFDDMVMMYDTESIMGKPIILTEVMKQLEEMYDIDFSRIHVNFAESEKEFLNHFKFKGRKNDE